MKIDEMVFSKLTEEQKKKVESAKTPEELLAIAEEAGHHATTASYIINITHR